MEPSVDLCVYARGGSTNLFVGGTGIQTVVIMEEIVGHLLIFLCGDQRISCMGKGMEGDSEVGEG